MKNVTHYEIQQCIMKTPEVFENDIHNTFGPNAYIAYTATGIKIFDTNATKDTSDDTCLNLDYVKDRLSVYYDCNIISLHFDKTDHITIWMSYSR